ncbi:hypothetical protein ACLMJK_002272 [Lecanora helva]
MSSPSQLLSCLPSEILVGVFESMDKLESILALSQTSSRLFNIWQLFVSHICKDILERTIKFRELADNLFGAQQRKSGCGTQLDGNHTILERTRRMISNQRTAQCVLESYEKSHILKNHGRASGRSLTPNERRDVIRAFYRMVTAHLSLSSQPPTPVVDCCGGWRVLDLMQVVELLNWSVRFRKRILGIEFATYHDPARLVQGRKIWGIMTHLVYQSLDIYWDVWVNLGDTPLVNSSRGSPATRGSLLDDLWSKKEIEADEIFLLARSAYW